MLIEYIVLQIFKFYANRFEYFKSGPIKRIRGSKGTEIKM
jgi:hypothetical protein